MTSESLIELNDATFDERVLNADQPVLVDFWADWCQPCRILGPTIESLAEEFHGRAMVGKLDTDANQVTALKYNISSIPTVIVFHRGEPVRQFVGLTPKDDLAAELDKLAA